jgi:hypothetical protein
MVVSPIRGMPTRIPYLQKVLVQSWEELERNIVAASGARMCTLSFSKKNMV